MDIVLRESERLNDTIRSFLAYARPQRVRRRARRPAPGRVRHGACCCATAPTSGDGPRDRRRTSPVRPSGSRPTRARSGRSSGTSRPTACGRCRTAAACASASVSTPPDGDAAAPDGRRCAARGAGRRGRHPGRRAGRHLPAVPRHLRARAAASAWPSSTASSATTTARSRCSSTPGAGHDGRGAAARPRGGR